MNILKKIDELVVSGRIMEAMEKMAMAVITWSSLVYVTIDLLGGRFP